MPSNMAEGRDGIAEDADNYGELADKEPAPAPVKRAAGIASDAPFFESLGEDESTDAARRLDSDWLYQKSGHVYGPVKAKQLLEMLYKGEITADTPVSVGEGELIPIRRIGVFRAHLPKVDARLKEKHEVEAEDRRQTKKRLVGRSIGITVAIMVVIGGGYGVITGVRGYRLGQAEEDKAAQEQKLKKEIEDLLASVTIEPPLLPLVDEPEPPPAKGDEQKPRPRKKGVARFSGGTGGTEELSRPEIMAGVAKAFGGFKRCIVEQMQRDPDSIPEEILLSFVIDNDGSPRDITLGDRVLKKSPMRGCMDTELSRVRWRKYKGEVRNVEYPITIGRRG